MVNQIVTGFLSLRSVSAARGWLPSGVRATLWQAHVHTLAAWPRRMAAIEVGTVGDAPVTDRHGVQPRLTAADRAPF